MLLVKSLRFLSNNNRCGFVLPAEPRLGSYGRKGPNFRSMRYQLPRYELIKGEGNNNDTLPGNEVVVSLKRKPSADASTRWNKKAD